MTTTEREQLLDLWRRVPECKPHSLTVGAAGGQYVSLLTGRGPTDSLITDLPEEKSSMPAGMPGGMGGMGGGMGGY